MPMPEMNEELLEIIDDFSDGCKIFIKGELKKILRCRESR